MVMGIPALGRGSVALGPGPSDRDLQRRLGLAELLQRRRLRGFHEFHDEFARPRTDGIWTGSGKSAAWPIAFYSTLNEAHNLVETPRMEAQRFGLGVNGVLLREWSSPSMDRNAGGRPPERIARRPLRYVTSSSSARMRAAARPRSGSSSGPAEIEGAREGRKPRFALGQSRYD